MGKFLKAVNGILLGALVLILASMVGYVYYYTHHPFTVEKSMKNPPCEITMKQVKYWSETSHDYRYGMQYDGYIKNKTEGTIKTWVVEITLAEDAYIDSFWNAEMSMNENIMTLMPVDYNKTVTHGGQQTFGFVIRSDMWKCVSDYKITYYLDMKLTDVRAFWVVAGVLAVLLLINMIVLGVKIHTRKLLKKQKEFQNIIHQSFVTFANIIDAKDPYTKGHSQRVAIYAKEMARRMDMDEEEQEQLYYIALLHDIGKIGIADSILNKNGKLTKDERAEMEQHVKLGGDIMKDFTAIKGIEAGSRYHHERYDGKGYADGLKGEEIPLYARIICIADSFDAMSSDRCYRKKLPLDVIVDELQACAGTQFDPKLVKYMLDMIHEKVAPVTLKEGTGLLKKKFLRNICETGIDK